jgi:hypothetical protein
MNTVLEHLCDATSGNCRHRGSNLLGEIETASRDLMLWISYFESQKTGVADCLLIGVIASLRECAACLCLGLARPALNAMRLQIDLLLAWIFFKDHRVEWDRVGATGDGFKLKTELIRYFQDTCAGFGGRQNILGQCAIRAVPDPYRLLSAHIHGQSEMTLPAVAVLADVVASDVLQDEVVTLQQWCVEYLSDICWCIYAEKWVNLPSELTSRLKARFKSSEQKAAFFA